MSEIILHIVPQKERLGKLLPVGDTFVTSTKRMHKKRHSNCKWNKDFTGPLVTYEVLRPGHIQSFTKGKRKYVCKVISIVEQRTGLYGWSHYTWPSGKVESFSPGLRWWQFFYLVKILEN